MKEICGKRRSSYYVEVATMVGMDSPLQGFILRGGQVSVCLVGDFSKASPENMAQQKICRQYGMELSSSTDTLADAQVIVDALFGIGLFREVGGDYPALLQEINAMDAYRLAVDIPSGVSADDGQIMGQAFLADATITFAFAKVGQMLYPGKKYCGELIVSAIGIESCSLAIIGSSL